MGGSVARKGFDSYQTEQDIPVSFVAMPEYLMNALKSYLVDSIGYYGSVMITPDDDLGIGIDSQTSLLFTDFKATRKAFNVWNVDIMFKWYKVPPPIVVYNSIMENEIITSVA